MHGVLARAAVAALIAIAFGCKTEGDGPKVGSNSNWLTACEVPADCSSDHIPECACGVCTVRCATDEDCADIDNVRCFPLSGGAANSTCDALGGPMSEGLCLPGCEPGSCGPQQACVDGACVLTPVPDTTACNALPAGTADELRLADELLALAQVRRVAGDLTCGDTAAMAQPNLRLSPALICAARALAVDMERTRNPDVIDSRGYDTLTRLAEASYSPMDMWAEAFALEATSAEHALRIMLQYPFNCDQLASERITHVGIAVAEDVYVMTLAGADDQPFD